MLEVLLEASITPVKCSPNYAHITPADSLDPHTIERLQKAFGSVAVSVDFSVTMHNALISDTPPVIETLSRRTPPPMPSLTP